MTSQPEILSVATRTLTTANPQPSNGTAITETDRMFTLFPNLPTELRFKIWRRFSSQSRVIQVYLPEAGSILHTDMEGNETQCAGFRQLRSLRPEGKRFEEITNSCIYKGSFRISTTHEALLGTTRESRQIALEYWTNRLCVVGAREVWFGPRDVIQLNDLSHIAAEVQLGRCFDFKYRGLLDNFHTLCFNFNNTNRLSGHKSVCIKSFLRTLLDRSRGPYRKLKKIMLVCNESDKAVSDVDEYNSGPFQMADLTSDQVKLWQLASRIAARIAQGVADAYFESPQQRYSAAHASRLYAEDRDRCS